MDNHEPYVIVFDQTPNANLYANSELSTSFLKYMFSTKATTLNTEGYAAPSPERGPYSIVSKVRSIGKYYYYYIHLGLIEHKYGLDKRYFHHTIKLPKSWADSVYETKEIFSVDINDNITTTTIDIKYREKYQIAHENDTDVLVFLEDDNLEYFKTKIIYGMENGLDNVPLNLYCADKYDLEVELNF